MDEKQQKTIVRALNFVEKIEGSDLGPMQKATVKRLLVENVGSVNLEQFRSKHSTLREHDIIMDLLKNENYPYGSFKV